MVNLVAVWTINGITFSKINDESNVGGHQASI